MTIPYVCRGKFDGDEGTRLEGRAQVTVVTGRDIEQLSMALLFAGSTRGVLSKAVE